MLKWSTMVPYRIGSRPYLILAFLKVFPGTNTLACMTPSPVTKKESFFMTLKPGIPGVPGVPGVPAPNRSQGPSEVQPRASHNSRKVHPQASPDWGPSCGYETDLLRQASRASLPRAEPLQPSYQHLQTRGQCYKTFMSVIYDFL
jgi:hypothetical protein